MNIFCTSKCPKLSAIWLCNKHIVKQGVESLQILANCFPKEQLAQPDCPRNKKGEIRGHFNPKHPSCLFATKNRGNMRWLIAHAQEIFNEHYRRYPLKRHFAHDFLDWVIVNQDKSIVPEGELTDFTVAINKDKICRQVNGFDDLPVTEQYRLYIRYDKPFAIWPKGEVPEWYLTIDKTYPLDFEYEGFDIQSWG